MHYFCGGSGSLDLALTELDRAGHRKLYGPTQGSTAFGGASPTLVVRLEGGEVVDNAATVLTILDKRKLLSPATHTVAPDDTIESTRGHLNLPGYSSAIATFARRRTQHFPESSPPTRSEHSLPRHRVPNVRVCQEARPRGEGTDRKDQHALGICQTWRDPADFRRRPDHSDWLRIDGVGTEQRIRRRPRSRDKCSRVAQHRCLCASAS